MTVLAQTGVFSFAPQSGRIGEAADGIAVNAANATGLVWHRHRATQIDYAPMIDEQDFPLEVGSKITVEGAYRNGVSMAGGAQIHPRLESTFGWLLYAAMGTGVTAAHPSEAGVYRHTFKFAENECAIPWLAVRKFIPANCNDGQNSLGVTGYDNKLARLQLTLPQAGIISAQLQFIGRHPEFSENADTWNYNAEMETFESVPLSCNGAFRIYDFEGSNELPVTGVIVELINNLTTTQEERIVGSYYMDDIIPRSRAMQLRFTYKWDNPDLYRLVMTNAKTGNASWSPEVFISKKDGANYAFELEVKSPGNIPSRNVPYRLEIRASRCNWRMQGGVNLEGGGIIMQQYVGTVHAPQGSDEFAEFILDNEVSAYNWVS